MGDLTKSVIISADRAIAATYQRFPVVFTKGQGTSLWDADGQEYTDFVAGIAVCNLGHANQRIAEALYKQAQTLVHVSNLYYTRPQTALAEWLTQNSFADRVFFCNSGAEANEAAIKLVRKYYREQGEPDRYRIVAAKNSFHGRTMATLSATGQSKIRKGFDPVLEGFDFVPFNDIEAMRAKVNDHTCAVILEPIQGEGGVRCPDSGYLREVRELCNRTGTLLVLDEIQTGVGRTGKLFAHEHYDVAPDVMTLAKALANGLPIGAMLAREEIAAAFGPGAHASTFGGTPTVTAVALEVLLSIRESNLLQHCLQMGAYFKTQLQELKQVHESIVEVRGLGLLLAAELNRPGAPVVKACMDKGYLINCVQDNILRFVPPLIIAQQEIDGLIACLDEVFKIQANE